MKMQLCAIIEDQKCASHKDQFDKAIDEKYPAMEFLFFRIKVKFKNLESYH